MSDSKKFDPTVRAKPNYPYAEFVKLKKFNSGDNQTPEAIAVPVFVNLSTVHREPPAFMNLKSQCGLTLVGYGNLDSPVYKEIRRIMDLELNRSPEVVKYMSALETKVEKAKANVRQAA